MVESGLYNDMVSFSFFLSRSARLPLCVLALAAQAFSAKSAAPPTIGKASEILRGLPIMFEPNEGRWGSDVRFSARTSDYRLFLTARGARLTVNQPGSESARTVSISLLNANAAPRISGVDALPVRTSYFFGSKKEDWRTGVANYSRVRYQSVYPGVDLVYYGAGSELEYDFMVRAGADPNRIRLQFRGIDGMTITPGGDLQIETAGARLIQKSPVVYQERPGAARREIHGKFKLMGRNVVGFEIEPYDRSLPLTIDPVLTYSSLITSSGADAVTALKVDAAGMLYLTGFMTNATDVTAPAGAFQTAASGGQDIFVAKLDPTASGAASLLYFTFIGGSGNDVPNAIALDGAGNVYLTGSTTSTNFPLAGITPSANLSGTSDAFVLKLHPATQGLDAIQYSTYLGGADTEAGNAIDVDSQGNIYVTGFTRSSDFQLTSSAYQSVRWGNQDAFISKLNPSLGTPLVYSSYLGGEVSDEGRAILVAPNGTIYFAANTFSNDFPLAGSPFRFSSSGGGDIVICQLDLTKSGLASLLYTTYFGGSGSDEVRRIALDSKGRLVIAGTTLSNDFPVTPDAFQASRSGIANVFVTRLDLTAPRDSVISYSTYLGGSGGDVAYDMALDSAGNAYVTGYTLSPDFPTTADALQQVASGGIYVFISKLNLVDPKPGVLAYSTYAGKSGTNVGYAIAVAPNGAICVAGQSSIRSVGATENAYQTDSAGGVSDGFVLVLR
jgi:hypothetical protein